MIHGNFQVGNYVSILSVLEISWTSGPASCNSRASCWLSFVTSIVSVKFKIGFYYFSTCSFWWCGCSE